MRYQTFKYDNQVNNNIPLGLDLPMDPARGSNFKMCYTSMDQASANLRNLLLTNKGERIMQPTLGCDLKKLVFDNIVEDTDEIVKFTIAEAIENWLPYIFINKLTVEALPDRHKLRVILIVSLVNNKLDTRSIQLEINLL